MALRRLTGMRVVVLGHRGLLGSAFAAHLRSVGADVVGVDRASYASRRDPADVVINAAGSSDKRLAESDPLASFRANADTTLASILDFPTALYVLLSSISVYEDLSDPSRNSEDTEIDAQRLPPYGFFKLMAESVVRRHSRRWLILRVGNVVGPGLRKNAVYDLLERRTLFVNPRSTMAFIDTRDVARIAWDLRNVPNEVFNISGRGTVELSALAESLGVALDPALQSLPLEVQRLNIDKLTARLNVPDSAETVARFCSEWRRARAPA